MTDPGHTPAEGYAASLRQQAEWIIEITGRVRQHSLDPSDIDTDELKAAAAFIEQQAARIAELEKIAKGLSDALITVRPLGGSELFKRFGHGDTEAYYADAEYCKAFIASEQTKLFESMKARIMQGRRIVKLEETLSNIAAFGKINLAGEYEHGLRGIIRSMIDCAILALDTAPTEQNKGEKS